MKNKITVIVALYLSAILSYTIEPIIIVNIKNATTRTNILLYPIILSFLYVLRDICDLIESKYSKKMIILSILNAIFILIYIMLLNKYIDVGLF